MVEEKSYYRYVGDHSQRQGYQGESRVDRTRLSWAMWDRGEEGRRESGNKVQMPGGQEVQKRRGS